MKEIENRADINKLVNAFYGKVRKHEVLGEIFNSHIPDDHWPEHLEKLTNFWETVLLGNPVFKGNPSQKHVNVDQNLNQGVRQEHFDFWLGMWRETIDEMYDGRLAQIAKERASMMAIVQFSFINRNRI